MQRARRLATAGAGAGLVLGLVAGVTFAADHSVGIAGFAFDPASITVAVGDTVTWRNEDGVPHTATADDGSFDTGNLADGASGAVTFDTAGTFAYSCKIHASMHGTVVVQAAVASSGGATVTPAPTDSDAPPTSDGTDPTSLVVTLLAILGGVMLASTAAFERRVGVRRPGGRRR